MMDQELESECLLTELNGVNKLYHSAGEYIAKNLQQFSEALQYLPLPLVTDIYEKAFDLRLVDTLQRQLSNLDLLETILKNSGNWRMIHKCLQLVLLKERDFGFFLASQKVAEYRRIKQLTLDGGCKHIETMEFIYQAIRLGSFFSERGMYECSKIIYHCVDIVDLNGNIDHNLLAITFEVALRIAHVLTLDCKFEDANKSILNASLLLSYMQNANLKPNCALFYTTCSMYMFSLSQYDKAHNLALQAVEELDSRLTPKVIVDTLRQACKTCIIKRIYSQANIYMKEALKLAKHWFGIEHPKYADCLSDYGFYLLSVDSVSSSVKFYEMALSIRQNLFGEENIITAITHEDIAYAVYVRDYSQGDFDSARSHAEQALNVLTSILPVDHLLLSSSKRVQALILEEVAIDSNNNVLENRLLNSAENLHLDSLRLARQTFGENNVQTAKHYGNLGRLYQSMKKYKDAELNHLKAIEIKERLLGREDYEVALSIGHLASLYNYDMGKYDIAESLYFRSIQIGQKLFGVWYSGLEYDYRGLVHLYESTGRYVQMSNYQTQLADWKQERENISSRSDEIDLDVEDERCVDKVITSIKATSLKHT